MADVAFGQAQLMVDQLTELHLTAVGQRHRALQQLGDIDKVLRPCAHHDFDLFARRARGGHDLALAIQAQQTRHLTRRDPGAGELLAVQQQTQLVAPGHVVVGDVLRPGQARHLGQHRIGGRAQLRVVVGLHLDADRPCRRRPALELEKGKPPLAIQGFDVRAQRSDDVAGVAHAIGARQQRHQHLRVLVTVHRLGVGELQSGVGGDRTQLTGRQRVLHHTYRALGFVQATLEGDACRHINADIEQAYGVEGEELQAHHARSQRPTGGGHHQHQHRHARLGAAHHGNKQARILDPYAAGEALAPGLQATAATVQTQDQDVRGHDPVGLEQAHQQADGDHKGHDEHEVTEDARQQHQGQKGGDRGQHRGQHRQTHFADAVDHRAARQLTTLQTVVDGLDDHHRVIDQHAERDHHPQQHRQVERVAHQVDGDEGARQRKRHTQTDQHGQTRAQEQPARRQHREQAEHRVRLHDGNRAARRMRLVVDQGQAHALRSEQGVALRCVRLQAFDQLQGIGARLLGDRQHHRGLAVVAHELSGALVAARHLRHFVQRHPPLRRDDGSLRELFRVWRLAFEARQPFAVLHADTSAQRVAKPGRDAISELHWR